jgi:hypothetical protein
MEKIAIQSNDCIESERSIKLVHSHPTVVGYFVKLVNQLC